MKVCQYASMPVYTCLYKKLNKNLAKRGYEAPFPPPKKGLNQYPFPDRVNSMLT